MMITGCKSGERLEHLGLKVPLDNVDLCGSQWPGSRITNIFFANQFCTKDIDAKYPFCPNHLQYKYLPPHASEVKDTFATL